MKEEQEPVRWEFDLLYFFQSLHVPWLDRAMVFVTSLADHGGVWLLLAVVFVCFSKTRKWGASAFLCIGLGYITGNLLLKNLIARSRPCWIDPAVPLLVPVPRDYSFPSGHTLVSFEGAVSVWLFDHRWGWAAVGLAILIGCSRMYLFVHFPTDVLAGMALGIVNAYAAAKCIEKLGTGALGIRGR